MIGRNAPEPGTRLALTNGRLVLPDRVVEGQALLIEGARILGFASPGELGDAEQVDVGGRYITPGLVDIHTHGGWNHRFDEADFEAYRIITEESARRGITALLPTTAGASIPSLVDCLNTCREWMSQPRPGAQILGMHMESPYISMAQKGAQNPKFVRLPDDGSAEALFEHAAIIRIFVLAPELPGALDLVRRAARLGIVVSAGHSMAKDEEILRAMDAGLSHITHLWSAMSMTVREGPWRKPGIVESALLFDGLTVEMISDNRHLPPNLMKLAYKCAGPDRLMAVSDSSAGAGLPEGARFRAGDLEREVVDGVAMLPDRTAFAGSTTPLNQMVPILVREAGIPLHEAVRMTTLTPCPHHRRKRAQGQPAPRQRRRHRRLRRRLHPLAHDDWGSLGLRGLITPSYR